MTDNERRISANSARQALYAIRHSRKQPVDDRPDEELSPSDLQARASHRADKRWTRDA